MQIFILGKKNFFPSLKKPYSKLIKKTIFEANSMPIKMKLIPQIGELELDLISGFDMRFWFGPSGLN